VSKYRAYSVYKNSGVEWLGEVPEHWEVAILKRKFNVQLGKMLQTKPISEADTEEEYLCAVNIQPNGLDLTNIKKMWFSENDKNKYELKKGDLLVSEGGDVGRSAIYDLKQTLYIQNAINRIRPIEKDLTKFLYYWIYSLKIKGYIDIICNKSTISHFTAEKVEAIETLLPPPKEQQQIVAFLDNKTAHLDTLIEKKQQMIRLLNEKRIALITQAVTKGLDLSVSMKDSGVEWLGNVPKHWGVMRISHVSILKSGDAIVSEQIGDTGTYPVYGGNGLRGYFENFNHDGDYILIGRQGALCGNINYGYGKFWASEHAVVVHPTLPLNFKWLGETLRVMNLNQYNVSSAQPGLAIANIVCLKIPFPTVQEQNNIALYIENETTKLDRMINTIQSAIAKLQEYRTALITAAVTGKIDVRTLTPHEG
jgi:type I restriction enzyme S subunit